MGSLKKSWVELESESATAVLSWLRSAGRKREKGWQHEPTTSNTEGLPKASVPAGGLVTALQRRQPKHSRAQPVLEAAEPLTKGVNIHGNLLGVSPNNGVRVNV